jgi:hypothetical protein
MAWVALERPDRSVRIRRAPPGVVAALWVSGGVLFVLSEWFVYENDRFPRALFADGNAYVFFANDRAGAGCCSIEGDCRQRRHTLSAGCDTLRSRGKFHTP